MKRLTTLIIAGLAALAQFSVAAESDDKASQALVIASKDFQRRLAEDKSDWEYADYVRNISNYSIGISRNACCYFIVYVIRQPENRIHGGGGIYRIDKRTLEIIRFAGDK